MKPAFNWIRVASLMAMLLAFGSAAWAQGAAPAQASANPGFTIAESNAYNAAKSAATPQAKIQALEAFIAQYNNPTLTPYAYRDLYQTYYGLKNVEKTIEYVDKFLPSGAKFNGTDRLTALATRAQAYQAGYTNATLQTPEILTKTREASAQGLTEVAALTKGANLTDAQFDAQKAPVLSMFNSVAGIAATYQKDYKAAITSFKAALVLAPKDAATHYRLGGAYLQDTPPQTNDGFWELGRAIALQYPGADQVKTYMRTRLIQYQQPACDKLADDEINEVLTLSAASADRPADLNIPSAADLQAARDDTNNFLPWLQEGGAHAKTMWLATCGLEFPDFPVRVMEIVPGDAPDKFTLRVFQAPTEDAMKAATAPNMEIHIAGQADVKKLHKDDYVQFTGTVTGYQSTPFLLTWDESKVNEQDLQDATPATPAPGRGGRPAAAPGKGRGGA